MARSVSPERRSYLPALTSLRFFAALWVVVFHAWRWDVWEAPAVVERAVAGGPVAVTFFFVLSGFVLTWTYERDGRLRGTKRAFFVARFSRLYPLYAFALVATAPIALVLWKRAGGGREAFLHDVAGGGAAAFAMVQAWWPDLALAWNPPAWSLSVEAFFYVLFPLALPLLVRRTRAQTIALAAALWLASVVLSVAYLAIDPDGLGSPDHTQHAFWIDALKYHPLARVPEFLLGVAAGALYTAGVRVRPVAGAVALGVGVALAASGALPYALFHNGLLTPLFALGILGLASVRGPLAHPALTRLGDASYALYILHVPVLFWTSGLAQLAGHENVLDRPLIAGATVMLSVVVSLLAYRWVETPLRKRIRTRMSA